MKNYEPHVGAKSSLFRCLHRLAKLNYVRAKIFGMIHQRCALMNIRNFIFKTHENTTNDKHT